MADENRQPGGEELGDTARRAREIASEARGPVDTPADPAAARPALGDATRDVYDDATGALERSERIRAADDARTDERQEELARMEAETAEQLRRNAETLRRTAEEIAETRERTRRIAADARELVADVHATREDTSRVGEAIRSTPTPIVDPPPAQD